MVDEIKKAIQKLEKLSPERQREIAKLIEDELCWDHSFSQSQDKLSSMASEAKKEYNEGKTSDKDW